MVCVKMRESEGECVHEGVYESEGNCTNVWKSVEERESEGESK